MNYSATQEHVEDNITRYRLLLDGQPMGCDQVVHYWLDNGEFRHYFTGLLKAAAYSAYRWEVPILSQASLSKPFEFVLVDYPSFIKRPTDRRAYREYFVNPEGDGANWGVVTFPNLSGDALLVVPSPRTDKDVYGHLAAFVRGAPEEQVDALWKAVGTALAGRIKERPVWLSTAGGGVAWLHVRLDRAPKYYAFAEYRSRR